MMINWFIHIILLGYEEALWPNKLEISHASQILTHEPQILVLSYLSNYYCTDTIRKADHSFLPYNLIDFCKYLEETLEKLL